MDVLSDIVESNGYEHLLEQKARALKDKLSGYTTMSKALRNYLQSLGFDITEEGKHYRLRYYEDPRYHVTMSKSGSDWREGENIASQIVHTVF